MTDLATRIADVRKKAEAAMEADDAFDAGAVNGPEVTQDVVFRMQAARIAMRNAAYPSLFIEMADEIDRLTAQLEKAREALERHRWNIEEDGDDLLVCDGLHEKSEGCQYVRYTPAARVHAELTGENAPSN